MRSWSIYKIGNKTVDPDFIECIKSFLSFKSLLQHCDCTQETGDMVICRTSDKQVVWASGTKDSKAVKAVLKKDGNFGLQDADGAEK